MLLRPLNAAFFEDEARALLTRLARVRPFSLTIPMVKASTISHAAFQAIEQRMLTNRQTLRRRIAAFLAWIRSPGGRTAPPPLQQRRFTVLRLRFNADLDQLDIFSDVLTERSEHEYGIWLAGLDALAADGLRLSYHFFDPPAVMTYLERGHGAAIRRARTRLPGGEENPVAIIQVPRERMIGNGIGCSLIHEVGHQASALLGLVPSFQQAMHRHRPWRGLQAAAWDLWQRWLSEIIADFWAVAMLGASASSGMIGVLSLPRAFVFRISADDPHPAPFIRARLSCAIGQALYPDDQWGRLDRLWRSFYPLAGVSAAHRAMLAALEATMPGLVRLLVEHRPASLRGLSMRACLPVAERQPANLRALFPAGGTAPSRLRGMRPTLAFAVFGQARLDGRVDAGGESEQLGRLLEHWALRREGAEN